MSKESYINKDIPTSHPQPPNLKSAINDIFFKGLYKEVWKKLIPPGLSEAECDFIEDVANLQNGDCVLDLMCGYGRHTLPLARSEYPVTAIDNLEDYIKEIDVTVTAENLPVQTIEESALTTSFPHQYKAAICMGNSFAFFDRENAISLLKKIAAHLLPEGVLIINSWMIAEIAIKHFKEREWINVDTYKYLMRYNFLFNPHRIESEHTVVADDGRVEVINGIDYIFTLAELEAMFQQAGLTTEALYSTPKKRTFKFGDSTIYIVVKKCVATTESFQERNSTQCEKYSQ
jgi:cyclopropane fatty-acyl-phospholipid synthase-like methyltransferase